MAEIAEGSASRSFWLRLAANLVVALFLVVWCGLGLAPVVLALPIGAILIALRRLPWLFNFVALLLLPSVFAFCWGGACYWFGLAQWRGMGFYRPRIGIGVNRETRVPNATGGCMVTGGEWLVTEPNNLAVYVSTKLFGYMRGTYSGPWPTKQEAWESLRKAHPIKAADLAAGHIQIADRPFDLAPVASTLGIRVEKLGGCAEDGCILAAVSKEGCLVLGFTDFDSDDPRIVVPIGCAGLYMGQPLGWYHSRQPR